MAHIWPLPRVEFLAFDEIEEERPVILVTSEEAQEALGADLAGLDIVRRVQVQSRSLPNWMELAAGLLRHAREAARPVLYAAGDGLAADAAKYFAQQTGLPLTILPTALTGDAFFTAASAIRHDGCISFIETVPADRLVIDFDLLAAALPQRRAAGIGEILSIATALWDWEYAEELGRNPEGMELVPWAADAAMAILQGGIECAEAAGAGDPAGLKQLLDCMALEVQLRNQLGHSRPVEGSEHFFAYSLGNHTGTQFGWPARLGAGILAMAARQDQDGDELRAALEACHIRPDTVPDTVVAETLAGLPAYVIKHDLPFGIAHEADPAG